MNNKWRGSGFTLASRPILPRATERKVASSGGGCRLHGGTMKAIPRSSSFLFVGVMTAQKYLNNRAVAAYR
ncbi:hypothetical protein AAFF_G00116960 [Aldrovandia affinis]|uniref:Uncharacterized protein n=1 Tax=Aldrovandia affinis TaxID=143900 RepID=A0AAD7T1M3_9TELE|nr:hypothetical protein AAFF_G00116960 [Aldrovandia affinis]